MLVLILATFFGVFSCGRIRDDRFLAAYKRIHVGMDRPAVKQVLAAHKIPIKSESDTSIRVSYWIAFDETKTLNVIFDTSDTVKSRTAMDTGIWYLRPSAR